MQQAITECQAVRQRLQFIYNKTVESMEILEPLHQTDPEWYSWDILAQRKRKRRQRKKRNTKQGGEAAVEHNKAELKASDEKN